MPNTKPANKCLPVAQLTQMVPDIPLPPIFREFPARYAHQVLDQLEAAAECGALPGFEGDPRGMVIVEAWRAKVERELGSHDDDQFLKSA